MIFDWPTPLLSPLVSDLRLINQTRSAGESLTGFEQVADPITQRWAFTLEFNNLKRDAILPYRALIAALRGRRNAVRVPVRDPHLWPSDAAIGITAKAARGDPWASLADANEVSDVAATISVLRAASSATVNFSSIQEPRGVVFPGQYFSMEDELHIITAIEWIGSNATMTFEPTARRDHSSSAFKFRPTIICRLASDESGSHPLERGILTSPTVDFVEILPDELDAMEAA